MRGRDRGYVATAADGVTVEKYREPSGTAIGYEISSVHAASVRLVEPIPGALEASALGFVGSNGEQPWSIRGPKLVFERTIEAGERIRTGVAARGDHAGAITALLDAPEMLEVEPVN